MPLGVAILGVDRDDQALQHVEAAGHDPLLLAQLRHPQRVATGRLGFAERDRRHGQQLGQRRPVLRIAGDAGAGGDRQLLRLAELHADARQHHREGLRNVDHRLGIRARLHEQELVGSVARELGAIVDARQQHAGHATQDLVTGLVTVVVVEEPEVVDVDQRQADGVAGVPRRLDLVGQQADHRTVVEEAGQRIAPGGLQQLPLLGADPRLCGTEDEEQDPGQQHGGSQGHDHDVATRDVDVRQQRRRIAPHGNHGGGLAVGSDDR